MASLGLNNSQLERLFPGDSEMAGRMRALDWSATDFGPPESWPGNLRFAVSICLSSRFPILLWWGPKLNILYNDAYLPWLTEEKHPRALGRPGIECWPEIWSVIGPMMKSVLATGKATRSEDMELYFARRLPKEEVYITYTYDPILAMDAQTVDGIFNPCTETTEQVVGARRLETLRKLGIRSPETRTVEAACQHVAAVLSENPRDISFAAIYVLDASGTEATMRAAIIPEGEHSLPRSLSMSGNDSLSPWPLASVLRTKRAVEIGDLVSLGVRIRGNPWRELVSHAIVLPIFATPDTLAGLLVAGAGARRPWDSAYRTFLELVAGHVGSAISDARAYEEERRRAEALAEIDRAKTVFFSNVSHEFRTPLTLMLGSIEDLLARGEGEVIPENRAVLNVAHRNGLRLLKLVNTLLDFSRIEAGRVQASYQPTDLAALTTDLASSFGSAVEKAGLRLAVECPPLAQPVYVDRDMWEKIVLNLISNAFKFTFEGEIGVNLGPSSDGRSAELTVRDTGIGIPPSEVPRLFERFHRVQGARGRTYEGTGIGLALVQELAKLHGGKVSVESEPERGSAFTVSIPFGTAHLPHERIGAAATPATTATKAEAYIEEALRWLPEGPSSEFIAPDRESLPPREPDEKRRGRVLLVEDNADMRDYLKRLLITRYDVTAAANGQEALNLASAYPPDLVLSDVMMPVLDGLGLLQALRAHPATSTLPVILLSARAGEEARVQGLAARADDYLVKPFTARELLARVEVHLSLSHMRKQEAHRGREMIEAELKGMTRLHEVASRLLAAPDLRTAMEEILVATCTMMGSRMGNVQIHDPRAQTLTIVAQQGFSQDFLDRLGVVTPDSPSASSAAMKSGRRVIVEDVNEDNSFQPLREIAAAAGFRSLQSTPLLSRTGALLGVLSTHWSHPHRPSEHDLYMLDLYAREAADVLDHLQTAQELRHSFDQLAVAINATQLGTFEYNPQTGNSIWSDLAKHHLGLSADATVNYETFLKGLHPYDRERVARTVQEVLRPGNGQYAAEYRTIGIEDGVERWISAWGRVFFDPEERPVQFVGVTLDITERKRLEEQLRQAQKLESVGRLAGGVAHDFNNLLTVINGYSALLLQTYPTKDSKRVYIEEIGKAGERAASLTKQLLAFSRKQLFSPKVVDLNTIVKDAERMLGRLIEENIRLIITLQPGLGRVMADPDRIHQVLMNMAVNARDAMPNGGNLVIETANIEIDSAAPTTFPEALPGRYVLLSVTDTGAGMDEATRQRVFEPFFTTKEVGKGTGLGLSTVYGIVKQSGGFIEVRSELGRGASFKIYLPRVDDRLPPDTESEPETDTASHGGETVLLVEDQEEVRGLVKNILKTHGYVVLEAANGAEACAVAREHSGSIHLLLTDLVMPGISGIELSERLRVSYPKLKVLLTSGYMQDFVSNRGVLERGISYLPKPFSPNELAAKIRETLAGS